MRFKKCTTFIMTLIYSDFNSIHTVHNTVMKFQIRQVSINFTEWEFVRRVQYNSITELSLQLIINTYLTHKEITFI